MRAGNLAPLLLLGLFMRSSGPSLPTPSASSDAPGLEVPRTLTGGQPFGQWFGDRFALALEVLRPNVPADKLTDIALSVVAQWAHETARGLSEFNFNLGGWHARPGEPFFSSRDQQTSAFPVDASGRPMFGDAFGSHRGTDIFAPVGTPVLAIVAGTVRADNDPKGGQVAYLRAPDGASYYYAHLREYVGTFPRAVQAGEVIGTVGTTGNAQGKTPHLHFEVHPQGDHETINPFPILTALHQQPPVFRWTAYSDLPNALHDQLRRLHDRYPSAWALLVSEPNTSRWIEELGRKGYYTAKPANYARAWAANRAELGVPRA